MTLRVLLADPDTMLLESCREVLAHCGFEVQTVSEGATCLETIDAWRPDVVVLEPDMPNAWGERIVARLTQSDEPDCAVLLILTRRDQPPGAIPRGVQRYLVKPVPMPELIQAIRSAGELGRQPIQRAG